MKQTMIESLKSLCGEEVRVVSFYENSVTILVPYDSSEFEIEIEGDTDDEQIESFMLGVNHILDSMINHLEDCKLNI